MNTVIATTTEALDREYSPPEFVTVTVWSPLGLDSHAAVEWVLTEYGDMSETIECMGGREFRLTVKAGG